MSAKQAVDALRKAIENLSVAKAALKSSSPHRSPSSLFSECEVIEAATRNIERIAENVAERAQQEVMINVVHPGDEPVEKVPLERALEMLDVKDGYVHTFVEPLGGMLVGTDWELEEVKEQITLFGCELSGPAARAMKHGLCCRASRARIVFFATKQEEQR